MLLEVVDSTANQDENEITHGNKDNSVTRTRRKWLDAHLFREIRTVVTRQGVRAGNSF